MYPFLTFGKTENNVGISEFTDKEIHYIIFNDTRGHIRNEL